MKSSPPSHSYVSLPEGMISKHGLVGGLEHDFYDFHSVGDFIITDEVIFFRGVG